MVHVTDETIFVSQLFFYSLSVISMGGRVLNLNHQKLANHLVKLHSGAADAKQG